MVRRDLESSRSVVPAQSNEYSLSDRLNQLLQTPRCDERNAPLMNAGVVKVAGGSDGDEDADLERALQSVEPLTCI